MQLNAQHAAEPGQPSGANSTSPLLAHTLRPRDGEENASGAAAGGEALEWNVVLAALAAAAALGAVFACGYAFGASSAATAPGCALSLPVRAVLVPVSGTSTSISIYR